MDTVQKVIEPLITADDPEKVPRTDMEKEIFWITQIMVTRYLTYFSLESEYSEIEEHIPPSLSQISPYGQLVNKCRFNFEERVALSLCLLAKLKPQVLDLFFTKNETYNRNFVEFGGLDEAGRFIPTGETLLFLLAGDNIEARCEMCFLLHHNHRLYRQHILELVALTGQPREQGVLGLSPESEARLMWNEPYRPVFGNHFPASLLETKMEWEDLVLPPRTNAQISEINTWIKHGTALMEDLQMAKKLRPGLRCLFYGPPGTGKTLTASLIGKESKLDVYRVDLSMVVSKYIGETEKNLSRVFDMAEYQNWILFFDEADALFGRRTQVQDAHDRYANQEVSYLLQRIETFDGIIILATNMLHNIDDAFSRRFECTAQFQLPGSEERFFLWEKGFAGKARTALSADVNLYELADKYELSGATIMNVVRYVLLQFIEQGKQIGQLDLVAGIRREYAKEGRTI